MDFQDFLYSIGEKVEALVLNFLKFVRSILFPTPRELPTFRVTKLFVRRKVTIHEMISLHLQLCFILYLIVNFIIVIVSTSPLYTVIVSITYFLYLRYFIISYGKFLIDEKPYRIFYVGISAISFFAFLGYLIMRRLSPGMYYYYGYVIAVSIVILVFRWYVKNSFGRDYTYGVVEEVKGDLVKVFIHDDIAANVKPGFYWLPKVEGIKPGDVVKVLVEPRTLRSSKPIRILEVLQSPQTKTEPKAETE